jgi:hypothetical protein
MLATNRADRLMAAASRVSAAADARVSADRAPTSIPLTLRMAPLP